MAGAPNRNVTMNARNVVRWGGIFFLIMFATCERHPLVSATPPTAVPSTATPSPTSGPVQNVPKKDAWDITTALGTALAALFAAASAWFSLWALKQTNRTQEESRLDAKRERMAGLWQHLDRLKFLTRAQLTNFDTDEVAEIVRQNVNTMGQLGYLWDVGLIDKQAAERELSPFYVALFDEIKSLGYFTSLGRTGADLIAENGYAEKLYRELKRRPSP